MCYNIYIYWFYAGELSQVLPVMVNKLMNIYLLSHNVLMSVGPSISVPVINSHTSQHPN